MNNLTNSAHDDDETLEIDRSVPSMQVLYDKLNEISQEFERSRELEMRRYKMLQKTTKRIQENLGKISTPQTKEIKKMKKEMDNIVEWLESDEI